MVDVATLSIIRRWALREQLSIRELARRTGLSHDTIRKYLRPGEAKPHYAKRVNSSKLDPFASKLSGWLKTAAGRSRKQRRTVKQMQIHVQALGYGGSYNRVAAFARPGTSSALWSSRPLAVAPSFPWPSVRARPSSLTGARTPTWMGNRSRWRICLQMRYRKGHFERCT